MTTTGRAWFEIAVSGFLEVVEGIAADALDRPALGVWDVRSLLGHASRALSTIESYLTDQTGTATVGSPAEYFAAAREGLADPAQVAERGRQAGADLGADPTSAVRRLGERVRALVDQTSDDCILATPLGSMTLATYLPTRAVELTVHGIDLARATDQPVPEMLATAATPAIELAAQIAAPNQRVDILLAVTGRCRLPAGFTVL